MDTSKITHVVRSEWTGELFMDANEAGDNWYLCRGDEAYATIEALIADWEQVEVEQHSYTEYRRP